MSETSALQGLSKQPLTRMKRLLDLPEPLCRKKTLTHYRVPLSMKMYNLVLFNLFYTPGLLAEAAGSSRTDDEYTSDYARACGSAGGLSQAVTSTRRITDRWAIRCSVKPSAVLIFLNLVFVSFVLSLLSDTVAARGHVLALREVPGGMLSQEQG